MTGPAATELGRRRRATPTSIDLKGVTETLLDALQVSGLPLHAGAASDVPSGALRRAGGLALPQAWPTRRMDERCGDWRGGGTWVAVGVLGEVHPEVARAVRSDQPRLSDGA